MRRSQLLSGNIFLGDLKLIVLSDSPFLTDFTRTSQIISRRSMTQTLASLKFQSDILNCLSVKGLSCSYSKPNMSQIERSTFCLSVSPCLCFPLWFIQHHYPEG